VLHTALFSSSVSVDFVVVCERRRCGVCRGVWLGLDGVVGLSDVRCVCVAVVQLVT
jgi:hypothetical protein